MAALASLGVALLLYALLEHDFSLRYVAQHSSRDAPLAVTLTGLWAGQAGSLLFWAWGLALLTVVLVWRERRRAAALLPGALVTLYGVLAFFFLLLATVSSPFAGATAPPSGRGLNPVLWDDGMRIHPPLLLIGYMSFSAPYALAIGALVWGGAGSHLRGDYVVPLRRWMLVAWTVQGAGLLAGAWWAYRVLGWGGYWGWDPVENVALLPWLTATAFLHSVMVQERRGMLKVWNLALAIASFGLAVFGTFVVRSGVLSSVHSFAVSEVGPAFLAFLALVVVGPLVLLLWRLPALQAEAPLESAVSREAGFLLNNLLLVGTAAAVFWGTVFPLVAEALQGVKVSVGAPFYQAVVGPLLLLLLVLMGVGPLLGWRRTPPGALRRALRVPLAVASLVGVVLFLAGVRQGLALLAFGAIAFTAATVLLEYWRGLRARRRAGEALPAALWHLVGSNRRRYGGYVVHLGMLCIALGAVASHFYQTEVVATLPPGGSTTAGRYTLTFGGLGERAEPGVRIVYADVRLRQGEQDLGFLPPERRIHRNWEQQPVTGVAVRTAWPWLEDVYVLLSGWNEDGSADLRVFVNPLVCLIWLGGGLFLGGTLLAAWPAPTRGRQGDRVLVGAAGEGDGAQGGAGPGRRAGRRAVAGAA